MDLPKRIHRRPGETTYERILRTVERTSDGCLLYGPPGRDPQARRFLNDDAGKHKPVAVIVWEHHNGPVSEGKQINHHCDVRACVELSHLYAGTHAENMRDMVARDRSQRGVRNSQVRLTVDQVLAIRADPRSNADVARAYGIWPGHVSQIRLRRIWQHV